MMNKTFRTIGLLRFICAHAIEIHLSDIRAVRRFEHTCILIRAGKLTRNRTCIPRTRHANKILIPGMAELDRIARRQIAASGRSVSATVRNIVIAITRLDVRLVSMNPEPDVRMLAAARC